MLDGIDGKAHYVALPAGADQDIAAEIGLAHRAIAERQRTASSNERWRYIGRFDRVRNYVALRLAQFIHLIDVRFETKILLRQRQKRR